MSAAEALGIIVTPYLKHASADITRVLSKEAFDIVTIDRRATIPAEAAADRRQSPEIAEANRPDYGLVGYVCGHDLRRAIDVAHAIECGTVVINGWRVVVPYAPYAGWRGSGIGCELGRPGLEAFIRWQHVRVLA